MPTIPWPLRLARIYAILRGLMLIAFSAALIVVPEKAMPGSSSEPARSLALIFASRTILLGLLFVACAGARKLRGLAWVFLVDAALQVFDTGMALSTGKGAIAALPLILGILDAWAGRALLHAEADVGESTQ